jgi:hypothetical protein
MIGQGITEEMVEAILLRPLTRPSTSRGIRYDGFWNDRRLCVVVDPDDETVIVSAFWNREE